MAPETQLLIGARERAPVGFPPRASEHQFRKIIGYRDLAKLVIEVERHAARHSAHADHTEVAEPVTV